MLNTYMLIVWVASGSGITVTQDKIQASQFGANDAKERCDQIGKNITSLFGSPFFSVRYICYEK
jgi:hypothetical protein